MSAIYKAGLTFIEEEILRDLSSAIDERLPEASVMVLFGSRARGQSDENSDLDLAVVLDVPVIDKDLWDRLWAVKWEVLGSLDSEEFPLSLMPITLTDFEAERSGIIREIKGEGVIVWERNYQRPR